MIGMLLISALHLFIFYLFFVFISFTLSFRFALTSSDFSVFDVKKCQYCDYRPEASPFFVALLSHNTTKVFVAKNIASLVDSKQFILWKLWNKLGNIFQYSLFAIKLKHVKSFFRVRYITTMMVKIVCKVWPENGRDSERGRTRHIELCVMQKMNVWW